MNYVPDFMSWFCFRCLPKCSKRRQANCVNSIAYPTLNLINLKLFCLNHISCLFSDRLNFFQHFTLPTKTAIPTFLQIHVHSWISVRKHWTNVSFVVILVLLVCKLEHKLETTISKYFYCHQKFICLNWYEKNEKKRIIVCKKMAKFIIFTFYDIKFLIRLTSSILLVFNFYVYIQR